VLEGAKELAMKTFYVYSAAAMRFLGTVEAIDGDTALMLAEALWDKGVCVLDQRHRSDRRIAA
jgi:hypothetical protein